MTHYQFAKIEGITARRASGKRKTQFSTRSLENALSENTLSKKAWLTTDELTGILLSLKHNQAAQNLVNKLFKEGLVAAPEEIKQKACDEINKAITESGDELIDLNTFIHPLSETTPNPYDPSDALCNMWLVASLFLREAVQGNQEARKKANTILFTYNPLKALPDWDNFAPLKSEVLRVVNDLQEGLQKQAEGGFTKD